MPDLIKEPPAQPRESTWKRLTRLFRSGPVIRHKISAGEPVREPQGTARAYKKELSQLYVHSLASYGQYERMARYADYSEMTFTPEIASALDIYADEAVAEDERGHILNIVSKDEGIKAALETLFFEILNIEFNAWPWVRNLCKFGDFILFVDASEENGILNLLPIPINEVEREEGFDKNDPFAVRFRWLTQGNMILQNWQIIHLRLLGDDAFLPYGSSMIEPARRIWRQLILIEDAMLVYRIVRSPERRVYYIDVGNVSPDKIPQFMEQVKSTMKRTQVVDPTSGRVDLRYNPLSVDEDYFIPVRGEKSSRIETLPGGQFTGDIEDVQYIQNKLFAALKIPKAYLGYEGEVGSKATLAQQDVRFARTIGRIQKVLIAELEKIAIIHLFLLGYSGANLVNFKLKLAGASNIAEQQKLELWRTKFEIAGTAQEGIFDRKTILTDIFGLSDEKIDEIWEGRKLDKLQDLELEAMTLPEQAPPPGSEPAPGEEELPDTLGGEGGDEGGGEAQPEEPAPAEAPPENAGKLLQPVGDEELLTSMLDGEPLTEEEPQDGEPVDEKKKPGRKPGRPQPENPGSEGNAAEISVTKGKDLFSTGESGHELAFGTKKQALSDPGDMRSLRRLVNRPFGESKKTRRTLVEKPDEMDAYFKRAARVLSDNESPATRLVEAFKKAGKASRED